jgi:hypothetical protein
MMYIVMILKKSGWTNTGEIRFDQDGLAGVMEVFRLKKDAVKAAKGATPPAQVLKVAER